MVSDRDILEHICYDMQDVQMLEMLKPCIDDGFVIQEREVSDPSSHRKGLLWNRLPSILLGSVARPRGSLEIDVFAMRRKSYRKNSFLISLLARARNLEKHTSSGTWCIDYCLPL